MSAKALARIAMLLGILLLLWGAAALTRRRAGGPEGERFALPAPGRTEVDSIRIARPSDTTVLARRDSTWSVNGHPASATAISDLFSALADTGTATELVAERPASHAGLGVDSASGSRIRFIRGDSVIADLIEGHRSTDLDGGYFRLAAAPEVYLVRGRLAGVLDRGPDEWRDHRIAAVPVDSVATVAVRRGGRSYRLSRGKAGWTLAPGGAPDTAAAARFVQAFSQVQAAGFATGAQADSARFDRPDRQVSLLRADGSPLLRLALDSTANGFWVRADSGATVYRIEQWTADRLAPADSTLR